MVRGERERELSLSSSNDDDEDTDIGDGDRGDDESLGDAFTLRSDRLLL